MTTLCSNYETKRKNITSEQLILLKEDVANKVQTSSTSFCKRTLHRSLDISSATISLSNDISLVTNPTAIIHSHDGSLLELSGEYLTVQFNLSNGQINSLRIINPN